MGGRNMDMDVEGSLEEEAPSLPLASLSMVPACIDDELSKALYPPQTHLLIDGAFQHITVGDTSAWSQSKTGAMTAMSASPVPCWLQHA